MARRIKVKLQDSTPARVIFLDPDATEGATLGTNVYTPDGVVGTPASIRAWLGVSAASTVVTQNVSGTINHHLLQGLLEGNDHPQYPLKAGTEDISGLWTFTNIVTIDINSGEQVVVDEDEVHTTVPIRATNYDGLLVENPDFIGAGVHITTQTGTNPLNNGIGTQIAFWEVGDDPGSPFTPYSYGFRIHHTGEIDSEGNMDWYRHSDSVPGVLFMRFTRESSQIQFADGSSSNPVITHIGDLNTGIYWRVADELNFSTGGVERLAIASTGIDGTVPFRGAAGSAANPTFTRAGDSDNGLYFPAADQVGISVNGVLRLGLTSSLITASIAFQGTTVDLGSTTDTTLSRASAGVLAVEGHNVPTVDQAQSVSAIYSFSVAPRLGGTLSPAQITANQDNYAPAGIGNASHLRLDTDASRQISGITTGSEGRFLVITNIGAFDVVLMHDGSGSTAANRFFFEGATNTTLAPGQTRMLWYDTTISYWRILMAGAGGGGGTVDSVVAGDGILVDNSDPINPIVAFDPDYVGPYFPDNGSAAAPAYSFASSTDCGMFLLNADIVSMVAGGKEVARYRNDAAGLGLQGNGYHSYSNMVSPAALSANTDNYNPTGLEDASSLRISATTPINLTGIVTAVLIGRILYVHNVGTTNTITLVHDATSTAANRFLCPNNANVALRPNGSVRIMYDVTSSRWRVQGA